MTSGKQDGNQDVLALVARQFGLRVDEIEIDATFVASGADSLVLMGLARHVESDFGVRVPVRELFDGTETPRKLVERVTGATMTDATGAVSANATANARVAVHTVGPAVGPAQSTRLDGVHGHEAPRPGPVHDVPGTPSYALAAADTADTADAAQSVHAVIDAQLRFADNLMRKFTELAGEQLRVLESLGRHPTTDPGTAVRPDPRTAVQQPDPVVPVQQPPTQPAVQLPDPPTAVQHPRPVVPAVQQPDPEPGPRPWPTQQRPGAHAAPTKTDFSLYFFGDYPDSTAAVDYQHLLNATVFADEHDFHAVWIPERHFHSFGALFPNPVVLASFLAARTSRVRLHAGSVVLPLHHPVRVAEEWSVVDNLSGGRVGLGFASGWHARDFVLAPENYARQREVLYENLDVFRRLWSGRPVTAPSGTGEPIDVTLHPRPVQESPPLAVAVLSRTESFERAAAAGLGVVTNLMVQSVSELRANIARYRRTRAAHGMDPAGGRVTVLVHTYLGTDAERAVREARQPFCTYLRSSLSLFDTMANSLGLDVDLSATSPEDLDFVLGRAYDDYRATRSLIGTPESVRPVLDALLDAGVDEVGCFIDFGVPPGLMLDGLTQLNVLRGQYAAMQQRRKPTPTPTLPSTPMPTPEPPGNAAPASALQRRMWLLDRMEPDRHTYHEPKAVLLEGPLDHDALRVALRRTVDRHPQLRTVFRERRDGVLEQVLLDDITVDCPVQDLTGLDDDAALRRLRDLADQQGFDLAHGPLLRARLGRLTADRHLLYLVAHHIVFDALSTPVFCRDLAAFYRAWPGEPDDLAPATPWGGHPADPDAGSLARSVEFWKRELAGAATLALPADRPRDVAAPSAGATREHVLDRELAAATKRFSSAQGGTVFMTVLGALAAVLGRFAGQHDVVLGTAVSSRPPGAEQAVGMFVETAALRLDLSGDPSFATVVRRVRSRIAAAIEHLQVPFDQVVEAVNPVRVPGANPLFQVMVEFEGETRLDFSGSGLAARLLDVPRQQAPMDLSFYFADRSDGIRCAVEYDTRLYDDATVQRILEYVEALLRHTIAAPDAPLSELPALTPRDTRDLAGWQGAVSDDEPACLHALFEAQARLQPAAIAVEGDGEPLTYQALDMAANRLAHALAARGVTPGARVALSLRRGARPVVAALAVLKCGAAYVPVDPSLPAQRQRFMLTDSAVELLIVDRGTPQETAADQVPQQAEKPLPCPVLEIDDLDPDLPATPLDRAVDAEAVAYHIYTSGTSGRPKAVAVPHRGPVNLIRWQIRTLGALRTVQWASIGFDVSVQEIFSTLASGATLVVFPDELRYDPAALAEWLRRHEVERLSIPYTPLKHLAAHLAEVGSLRQLLIGGERLVLTPEVRELAAACPRLELHNQYGPTETSVIATSHRFDPADGPNPPIGRALDNLTLRVVDTTGRPVPVGVPGELLIGGVQVAVGYFGLPELTEERFVADPLASGTRFYRTGDLVRMRGDGALEYLGRLDSQVKIRGHRVEPEETQRVLADLPGVSDAVVLARADHAGETELAAYVVLSGSAPADPAPSDSAPESAPNGGPDGGWSLPLRSRLSALLPPYLIPQSWTRLDRIPYTAHGKLDRAVLLAAREGKVGAAQDPQDTQDPQGGGSGTREALLKLWALELGEDSGSGIPVDRSFFDVGGNSLSAVRLLERIRGEFGQRIPVAEFFRAPTVEALAQRLDGAES